MSGYFSPADGVGVSSVARLNPDGTLDRSFFANFDNYVWYNCVLPSGKILFGGGSYTVDGISRAGIARLNAGPMLLGPQRSGNTYSASIATVNDVTYVLQCKSSVSAPNWTDVSTTVGDGTIQILSDAAATNNARLYRLQAH